MGQSSEMRNGRITQTAWQRAVRKRLKTERKEAVWRPSPWETCSAVRTEYDGLAGWADAVVSDDSADAGFYAVYRAAGDLAAKGIRAAAVSIRALFPEGTDEIRLAELAESIEQACSELNIQVTSFDGTVTKDVSRMVVFAGAAGWGTEKKEEEKTDSGREQNPGEIILCGYAGLEGMLRILALDPPELRERFVSDFLDRAAALKCEIIRPEKILNLSCRMRASVFQIGQGGIFASLWELAQTGNVGFEIPMSQIALKQETVEICEFYRLNPYLLTSCGSYLVLTGQGDEMLDRLAQDGVPAVRLGRALRQNAKVLISGEERRYLDRPAEDELQRWQDERKESLQLGTE